MKISNLIVISYFDRLLQQNAQPSAPANSYRRRFSRLQLLRRLFRDESLTRSKRELEFERASDARRCRSGHTSSVQHRRICYRDRCVNFGHWMRVLADMNILRS